MKASAVPEDDSQFEVAALLGIERSTDYIRLILVHDAAPTNAAPR